jgi:heme o synthase
MSTSSLAIPQSKGAAFARILDYLELTKPRIAVMELVVVLASGFVATWGQPDPALLLHAMLGTLLIAASASAANQWMEWRQDARMERTAVRPIPAGRLSSQSAIIFAVVTLCLGAVQLAVMVNLTCTMWALVTWALYVIVYTPLKARSVMNTAVGAVAGALPVLIGWSATGAVLDQRALALTSVLFLWQFPHFMAIAWLYRRDYAQGGYQMLTVIDPSGRRAGRQAVIAALALVPVSILPVMAAPGAGSVLYAIGAIVLGIWQLIIAFLFWRQTNETRARLLLRVSLVYLPTVLVMLMLAPWI